MKRYLTLGASRLTLTSSTSKKPMGKVLLPSHRTLPKLCITCGMRIDRVIFGSTPICVDQRNMKERGYQVLRMADIYSLASRVVVWLGPERDDSTLAIRELDALGSTIEVEWDTKRIKPLSGDKYERWVEEPLPFAGHRRVLVSIESLLDRSWFQRLWIVQEVQLANSGALVICGEETMLWDTLRYAIVCLAHRRKYFTESQNALNICVYNGRKLELR